MSLSSKLPVAVHILTFLSSDPDKYFTSDTIAKTIGTNPVVVRRIGSKLNKSGIIESNSGSSGGMRLSMDLDKISLFDIYNAVEEEDLFSVHDVNLKCDISVSLHHVLSQKLQKIESDLEKSLKKITISEIANETMAMLDKLKAK